MAEYFEGLAIPKGLRERCTEGREGTSAAYYCQNPCANSSCIGVCRDCLVAEYNRETFLRWLDGAESKPFIMPPEWETQLF